MSRLWLPLVVVVPTAVTGALVLFDVTTWVRIPVALVFAVMVPGLGWAWRLRLPDTADALLLAVTISVGLLVIVGEGMALLHLWSVWGGFLVLAAIALLGVAAPRDWKRVAKWPRRRSTPGRRAAAATLVAGGPAAPVVEHQRSPDRHVHR